VFASAVLPSGKILVGGAFTQVGATARRALASLNADGTLDTNFVVSPALTGSVSCFAVQPDGKIVFAEYFVGGGGSYFPSRVARVNANGAIDSSFPNINFNDLVKSIAIQTGTSDPAQEGKILVGGDYTALKTVTRNYFARFSSAGVLDSTFGPNPNGSVNAIGYSADTLAIGGEFTWVAGSGHNHYESLTLSGIHNPAYANSPDADSDVTAVLNQGLGGVVIGGVFTAVDGASHSKVAQFDYNGIVGALGSNNPLLPPSTGQVLALALESSNDVLAGGTFTFTHNAVTYQHIVRYSGGSQDLGFCAGAITGGYIWTVSVQSDGKILIGGTFTNVQGQARNYLARLDP
jgi:uncharacterized delta-60 repeat protein